MASTSSSESTSAFVTALPLSLLNLIPPIRIATNAVGRMYTRARLIVNVMLCDDPKTCAWVMKTYKEHMRQHRRDTPRSRGGYQSPGPRSGEVAAEMIWGRRRSNSDPERPFTYGSDDGGSGFMDMEGDLPATRTCTCNWTGRPGVYVTSPATTCATASASASGYRSAEPQDKRLPRWPNQPPRRISSSSTSSAFPLSAQSTCTSAAFYTPRVDTTMYQRRHHSYHAPHTSGSGGYPAGYHSGYPALGARVPDLPSVAEERSFDATSDLNLRTPTTTPGPAPNARMSPFSPPPMPFPAGTRHSYPAAGPIPSAYTTSTLPSPHLHPSDPEDPASELSRLRMERLSLLASLSRARLQVRTLLTQLAGTTTLHAQLDTAHAQVRYWQSRYARVKLESERVRGWLVDKVEREGRRVREEEGRWVGLMRDRERVRREWGEMEERGKGKMKDRPPSSASTGTTVTSSTLTTLAASTASTPTPSTKPQPPPQPAKPRRWSTSHLRGTVAWAPPKKVVPIEVEVGEKDMTRSATLARLEGRPPYVTF